MKWPEPLDVLIVKKMKRYCSFSYTWLKPEGLKYELPPVQPVVKRIMQTTTLKGLNKIKTFRDEYIELLKEHEIKFDEKYLL